jgi:hypothetical protein
MELPGEATNSKSDPELTLSPSEVSIRKGLVGAVDSGLSIVEMSLKSNQSAISRLNLI